MEITEIRIYPVHDDKLRAFVSVILDDCFVVSDIKIIDGHNGLFVSMPSKRRRNGTFRDIAHPLNHETRRRFEGTIIARYREVVSGAGLAPASPAGTPEGTASRAMGEEFPIEPADAVPDEGRTLP